MQLKLAEKRIAMKHWYMLEFNTAFQLKNNMMKKESHSQEQRVKS